MTNLLERAAQTRFDAGKGKKCGNSFIPANAKCGEKKKKKKRRKPGQLSTKGKLLAFGIGSTVSGAGAALYLNRQEKKRSQRRAGNGPPKSAFAKDHDDIGVNGMNLLERAAQTRFDAGKGKKCGKSYIPADAKCGGKKEQKHKKFGKKRLAGAAAAGLAVGIGGAAAAKYASGRNSKSSEETKEQTPGQKAREAKRSARTAKYTAHAEKNKSTTLSNNNKGASKRDPEHAKTKGRVNRVVGEVKSTIHKAKRGAEKDREVKNFKSRSRGSGKSGAANLANANKGETKNENPNLLERGIQAVGGRVNRVVGEVKSSQHRSERNMQKEKDIENFKQSKNRKKVSGRKDAFDQIDEWNLDEIEKLTNRLDSLIHSQDASPYELAYTATRLDKKCGASHIPDNAKCGGKDKKKKGKGKLAKRAAAAALIAGATGAAGYGAHKLHQGNEKKKRKTAEAKGRYTLGGS